MVRETRAKLIDDNIKNVGEWLARAVEKLQNNKTAEAPAEEEEEETEEKESEEEKKDE
jgi:ribosomal protein L12E/L44/L45/RPP1/RPP2